MERFQEVVRGLIALVVLGVIGYVAWTIWGPSPSKNLQVTVDGSMPAEDQALVTDAVNALLEVCPGVLEASDDVSDVSATISPMPQGGAEQYGWNRTVILSFTFDESVDGLPGRFVDGSVRYEGHSVRFLMGGGDQPGVIVEKPQAATLCLLDPTPGRNQFKAAPQMALIED